MAAFWVSNKQAQQRRDTHFLHVHQMLSAIKEPQSFEAILKSGKRYNSGLFSPHFLIHSKNSDSRECKIGFILPKKLTKSSVRRNLIRRLWKHRLAIKLGAHPQLAAEIVVRQKQRFDPKDYMSANSVVLRSQLLQEIDALVDFWLSRQLTTKQ